MTVHDVKELMEWSPTAREALMVATLERIAECLETIAYWVKTEGKAKRGH